MAEVASAYVSLLPSAKGFGSKLDGQISGQATASGKKAGGLFSSAFSKLAALGIGAGIVVGLKSVVGSASDAQQSIGATQTVFGKFSKAVIKDSTSAAKQFGLSANEYRENANLIGSLFKNQGVALDELGGKTKSMIGKASDLAATFGGTTKEAVEALGSAFKGEFDPLEKYGISLKQSTVNTEAMRLAHVKSTGDFEKLSVAQQTAFKQQAASNIITKQSADTLGAFGKESDTLAHKQQVLGAQFDNVKVMVGNFLLPILTKAFGYISETVIPAAQNFIKEMKNGEGAGGDFKAALDKIWDGLKKVYETLVPVVGFLIDNKAAVATFVGILAGFSILRSIANGFLALNAAMAANPIGLVVLAIAALAAGLVIAYNKSETFRNIVDTALKGVQAAFKFMWNNVVQPVLKFFIDGLADAMDMVGGLFDALSHVPGFGWAGELGDKMHGAADAARGLADNIKKIPNKTVTVTVLVNKSALDKVNGQLGGITTRSTNGGGGGGLGDKYGRNIGTAVLDGMAQSFKTGGKKSEEALKNHLDKLKGKLSTLKSDMASLADSVASAFTTDVFGGTMEEMFTGLGQNVGDLKDAKAAFGVLEAIPGISKDFLSELFASGNTALITSLAADSSQAVAASALFEQRKALAADLGKSVGLDKFGDRIADVRDAIADLREELKNAPERTGEAVGRVINSSASTAAQGSGSGGGWSGGSTWAH